MNVLKRIMLLILFAISINANATDALSDLGNLNVASSTNFGHTHSEAVGSIFYDDYVFTIPAASVGAFTSSLSTYNILGLDFDTRLYTGNTHFTGTVLPPDAELIKASSNTVNFGRCFNLEAAAINPIQLLAGTYTLQVIGTVTGLSGGSYAGVLNVTNIVAAVPEPESATMLILGLLILGGIARKRQSAKY